MPRTNILVPQHVMHPHLGQPVSTFAAGLLASAFPREHAQVPAREHAQVPAMTATWSSQHRKRTISGLIPNWARSHKSTDEADQYRTLDPAKVR